jgi:hypothetical protein
MQPRKLGAAFVRAETWDCMFAEPTPHTGVVTCEREETEEAEPLVRSELKGLKGELARLRADIAVAIGES